MENIGLEQMKQIMETCSIKIEKIVYYNDGTIRVLLCAKSNK